MIDAALKALQYPGIKLLILRRSYPELERSIIRTFLEVIPKVYSYNSSKHFVKFRNGSTLEFGYCDDDAAVYKYQSGNVKKCAVGKHPKSEKLGSAGQAVCCACTHSRYFTGGSPSGLRV